MKVLLVIPALNEERSLGGLLAELRATPFPDWVTVDIVVVDDGSTDATAQKAREAGVRALRLCKNLGIGGAVQTGIKQALRSGYDCAIQVDGDGQHPADQLMTLIEAYRAEPTTGLVVGSRYVKRDGFQSTFMRRLGAAWLAFVLRLFAGIRCTDPTSGFRLYGRRALEVFDLTYPYDYPEPESLAVASNAKLTIREVPVVMRERQGGASSIHGLRAAYYVLKVTLAIVFAVLRPLATVRR